MTESFEFDSAFENINVNEKFIQLQKKNSVETKN